MKARKKLNPHRKQKYVLYLSGGEMYSCGIDLDGRYQSAIHWSESVKRCFEESQFKIKTRSLLPLHHWAGCSTGLHYQCRKHAGAPKKVCVYACVRWSETGMSTRLWTIQYIMVTPVMLKKNTNFDLTYEDHDMCLWTDTPVYLAVSAFVRVWPLIMWQTFTGDFLGVP